MMSPTSGEEFDTLVVNDDRRRNRRSVSEKAENYLELFL
jgi:hypothetical protein